MSHKRRQIILHLVERLKAAGTLAGDKVFSDPDAAMRIPVEEMPAILVRPGEEVTEEAQVIATPRRYRRVLEVKVEAVAAPREGQPLDEIIDALDLALEEVVQADETQGGLALETILSGTEFPQALGEGAELLAAVVQTYLVSYQFPD